MGCGCVEGTIDISVESLKTLAMKLKYVCNVESQRVRDELKKLEELLIIEFSKSTKNRSRSLEESMIRNNLTYYGRMLIFRILENHAKVLQEHKSYFQDETKLSIIKTSLDFVLYCSSFLSEENLIKFTKIFCKNFPSYQFPSDNDISDKMVVSYKTSMNVDAQTQKNYIFELSNKCGIGIAVINETGHAFKY